MSMYVVDIEADGPIPGPYSMVSFGAVKVDEYLDTTYYGEVAPISGKHDPEALAISGFSRETHLTFPDPTEVMKDFHQWVLETSKGRPIFCSDNLAFDWQWINYYFHMFGKLNLPLRERNPFGFSGRRIGDLYCGLVKDSRAKWKHLRKTAHTHHPVDDARGNAEALLAIKRMGLKIDLK